MTLKLRICTIGQSMKLALSAGRYTSWNLRATARRPPPSVTVMKVKKHARPAIYVNKVSSVNMISYLVCTYRQGQRSTDPSKRDKKPAS